jgi:hypothetical protein
MSPTMATRSATVEVAVKAGRGPMCCLLCSPELTSSRTPFRLFQNYAKDQECFTTDSNVIKFKRRILGFIGSVYNKILERVWQEGRLLLQTECLVTLQLCNRTT